MSTGIDDVWSALTDPSRLALWYGEVEGDRRVAGEYRARLFAVLGRHRARGSVRASAAGRERGDDATALRNELHPPYRDLAADLG
jgi:uncharacterized protein YndB with AHSA1/START domain